MVNIFAYNWFDGLDLTVMCPSLPASSDLTGMLEATNASSVYGVNLTSQVTDNLCSSATVWSMEVIALNNTGSGILNMGTGLDEAQINSIFDALVDRTGDSPQIDVSGLTGAATCDTSIATAKSWNVIT